MAALNTTVHVYDAEGIPHIYGPGEVPPDWAIAKITNPDVWAHDEDDDAIADPVAPSETPQDATTPPVDNPDNRDGDEGGDTQNVGGEGGQGDPAVKPVDEWTVPQLREYAHDRGIDLGNATRRADILAAVKAATVPAPDGDAQA